MALVFIQLPLQRV